MIVLVESKCDECINETWFKHIFKFIQGHYEWSNYRYSLKTGEFMFIVVANLKISL
jgi:hypothetical protein